MSFAQELNLLNRSGLVCAMARKTFGKNVRDYDPDTAVHGNAKVLIPAVRAVQ